MKKWKLFSLLGLVALGTLAYAASEYRLGYDKVTVGNSTNSNKEIRFNIGSGSANPGFRGNDATSKVQFSHDGTVWEDVGAGGGKGAGGIVLNENPGFEEDAANWTASGGTFTINTTLANVGFEEKSGAWDASAASQTLSNDAVTVPSGLFAKPCSLSWYYKGGDANLKAQVYDGTSVIAESEAMSAQAIFSKKQILYFTCPSSGTIQARFIASADAAIVYFDDVRIGQEGIFELTQEGPRSEVVLVGCNGVGATSTKISRFLTNPFSQGTEIVYTDSVNTGAELEVQSSGIYMALTIGGAAGLAAHAGISVNATANGIGSTNIANPPTYAQGHRCHGAQSAAGVVATCMWAGYLNAGDIVTAHNGTNNNTHPDERCTFSLTKVSN